MPYQPTRRTPGAEVLCRREGADVVVVSKTELGEVELPPSLLPSQQSEARGCFFYQLVDAANGNVEFTGVINDPTGVTVEIPVFDSRSRTYEPIRKTREDLTRPHYFTLLVPDIPDSILLLSSPDMARAFGMDRDVPLEVPINPPRRRDEPDESRDEEPQRQKSGEKGPFK